MRGAQFFVYRYEISRANLLGLFYVSRVVITLSYKHTYIDLSQVLEFCS